MIITQFRDYHSDFTESTLHVNGGDKFCWVLEDIKQPCGVKVPGETCIPEGHYKVAISRSSRWGKSMMLLFNQEDMSVERFGVRFTGIRPHGGNDVDDTEGCPLLGYGSDGKGKVWDRASDDLFDLVQSALDREEVNWVITEKADV